MDEDLAIINKNTRNERVKNFFINNKKLLLSISTVLILILLSFYSYQIYKSGHRELISNKYNAAMLELQKADIAFE